MEMNPEGDPGFNPEHNKRVIEETIRKTDKIRKEKKREFDEKLRERAWATAKLLKNIDKGTGEGDPIRFFGKNYAMYLKGKDIIDRINEELKGN